MHLSRRDFLKASGATATLALWPGLQALATGSADSRLIVVLLRGGLDALHALPPIGDPNYARLRGALAVDDALPLDAGFGLHPSLAFAHELYSRRQFMPIVAIAPPYQGRSHFEAQDCVESGGAATAHPSTGWLNRCVASLAGSRALAIAPVTPLSVRGPGRADTWSPPLNEQLNPILLQRLQPLYAADPHLAAAFAEASLRHDAESAAPGALRLPQAMQAAARFMADPNGPRVAFVEDSGWDTHSGQAYLLARKLTELDAGLRAFHEGIGGLWSRTVVAVVTEFGRTAAGNGTGGTDHGTGGVAFLAGGAVKGGRIGGDWPGLAPAALFEGRDLRATSDLRSLFKGVLVDHLQVAAGAVDTRVFPDSVAARPMRGLIG